MISIQALPLGRYIPGSSPLHRLDARIKLLAAPLAVMAVFAAVRPAQLLLLTLVAVSGWLFGRLPLCTLWQTGRALRWLLLFTLLVHVLFTPGHTLWGRTWLSADGLATGAMVCWRLLLALAFALLLSATTAPTRLAAALGQLLGPLERLGIPVQRGAEMLLLVLYFIPIFREEALQVHAELAPATGSAESKGLLPRARLAVAMIQPLLLRLVDRGDAFAQRLAAGESLQELETAPQPEPVYRRQVLTWLLATAVLFILYRSLA